MTTWLKSTIIVAALFVTSCKDNSNEVTEGTDTSVDDSVVVENVDTVLSNETISFLNQSGLSAVARSTAPAFNWNRFRMTSSWKEDSLYIIPFKPAANFYDNYKPYLKYSPDSSMFIDLDSYNLSIQKDKSGKLVANEIGPDTEVSLVNVKDRKKSRLVFLGPGGSIEDGSWVDRDNLILMGFQESGDTGMKVPVVWRYNLPTTTFYIYELPDPSIAKQLMGQWRKERLKGLIFR